MEQQESFFNKPPTQQQIIQKDFYETLGITKNASIQEITKAYHRKAMETHPGKQKST